jgi:putative DNA primase/helicase
VSEGGIFFGGAGFQSDSAMTTLSILNDLWSGSALTIDRKGEGSIRLSDVALMMNIAVQSEVLRKFLTRTGQLARGSGFLARPLITMPESTQGFRPYKPPPELRALEQLISKFESLLLLQSSHLNDQGTLERITLELAPKARECWVAYYNEIEQAQQVGKYAEFIKAEASKSADNASRIAGIFHILEYGLTGTVSEQTMEQACRLARWHLDECRRFVFSSELPESLSAAQQLSQKIAAYLYQRFRKGEPHWNTITRREVQRECRVSGVQDIKSLQLVLDELQEADHILERKQEGKRHWLVMNPKLIMSHVKSNTKA